MVDQYRVLNSELNDQLCEAEWWLKRAWNEAKAAYPAGSYCIIRSKRWGHEATERVAKVVGTSVGVFFLGDVAHVSVNVNTFNIKTGKTRTYYPSCEVDGIPSIRMADSQVVGNG